MGEIKRAQELRVDEVSVQKLQEKIMRQYKSALLSCKKCQSWWILLVIRENFKKRNQITVEHCLTFPVNLQWFQVLVPCWAATIACLMTHGIYRDYRRTFLVVNFLRLIHPEIILKEFNLTTCKETDKQSLKQEGRRPFTQVRTDKIKGTIPMPTFATKPLTVSSTIPVELPQNSMVDSKDSKLRNCNSRNSLFPYHS